MVEFRNACGKEMSITTRLEEIYWKVKRTRNRTCKKIDGYIDCCSDCPYYNQYIDDCDFENIMKDIKDLINVVDPLGMYRNEEEEDD